MAGEKGPSSLESHLGYWIRYVSNHVSHGATPGFSAEGVETAVCAIQRQEIGYREFCRLIADTGCVGYFFVSLAGGRAVYYGRAADEHVECFPNASP